MFRGADAVLLQPNCGAGAVFWRWRCAGCAASTGQFCGETAVLLQCFSECFLVYILIFTMGFKQLLGK